MNENEAKIMWRVFQWANENNITVMFFNRHAYGGVNFPVLRFSRGNYHIERNFYSLNELKNAMQYEWKKIALELCVKPIDFKGLE